jgi:hypothetical protein
MTVNTIILPASKQGATERLGELGPLMTALGWERAALVFALTQPGRSGRRSQQSGINPRLSFSRFAALKVHGLTTHHSVARYWRSWQRAVDAGIAKEVTLGDEVDLPDVDFDLYFTPDRSDADEVVTEAILTDPRAVANAAYSELQERREFEEERTEALRAAFHEEAVQSVIVEAGCSRDEAESILEEEKRPAQETANRKAHHAEIRRAVKLATKIEEAVASLLSAAANDNQLIGDDERDDLRDAYRVLRRALGALDALKLTGTTNLEQAV